MADAGSTRSTRRSENALPATAASTSATPLMITRLGSSRYGMRAGRQDAGRAGARTPAPIAAAMSATTAAWATTPPTSVRDRAPIALSMPYNAMRSTVSSAKNSATTTTAITSVTPMIWLNTERCWRTPPIASAASTRETVVVVSPVARSIAARATEEASPLVCTTSAWNTPGPTDAPGRFAFCTSRHVCGEAQSEPAPE